LQPRRILSDRQGNFGILTALIMVPLLGCAGMAIDFTNALRIRSQLMDAADSAALGAITEQSKGVAAAIKMSADGDVPVANADGRELFLSQSSDSFLQAPVDVAVTVNKKGNNLSSAVHFSAAVPTTFLRIIGHDAITVSGTATAVYQTESFTDFYMLLDNTPSMGVGATPGDVAKMVAATSDKCAFACHIVNNGVDDKNSYYNLARKIGATIRIDVVAKATAALMDEAVATQKYANQFRIAAYTFGEAATDVKLFTVSKLTSDLNTLKKATANIKLMSIPKQNFNEDQQTSFDDALTKISAEIDDPGDGSSTASREKVIFFVADGVGDSEKPKGCTKKLTGNRCQEPIDTKYCDALKQRGIRIAVLYTTYLPLPDNGWYRDWISPFQNEIGTKMKECASDGLYFEVSPTEGIEAAMKALFLKTVKSPRLSS